MGLFYYAGHGFESGGFNLLMPVDTESVDKEYREWMALKLDSVIDALQWKNIPNELKTKIIIIDACRENPDGRGGKISGFSSVFAPAGTIIAFSTSPGQSAKEKDGHGRYTRALLSCIDTPRIPLENMFKQVRGILAGETSGKQISWEHTSLMDNYYFNEDRLDSHMDYGHEAYEDSRFNLDAARPVCDIIRALHSHNWNLQNPAIARINGLHFEDISPSDIFVLGRNIYQAAEGSSWAALGFIRDFSENKLIPENVKIHLLNGMAFEIYFNSHGKVRESFKTGCYTFVLTFLEMDKFQSSKNFIIAKLDSIEDRFVYIPGNSQRMTLHIKSQAEDEGDNGIIRVISEIFYNGNNILHYNKGITEYDDSYIFHTQAKHLDDIKDDIAEMMVAPSDMLLLTVDEGDTSKDLYVLPRGASLYKANEES